MQVCVSVPVVLVSGFNDLIRAKDSNFDYFSSLPALTVGAHGSLSSYICFFFPFFLLYSFAIVSV